MQSSGKPCRAACRRYLRSSSRSLNPKSQCSAGRAISLRGLSWERSLGLLAHGGLYTFPLRAHLSVVSSCKVLILRSAALRSLSYPSRPISLPWSFSSSSSEATGRDHNQDPNTPVSAMSAGNRFQDNESPSVSASLSLSRARAHSPGLPLQDKIFDRNAHECQGVKYLKHGQHGPDGKQTDHKRYLVNCPAYR